MEYRHHVQGEYNDIKYKMLNKDQDKIERIDDLILWNVERQFLSDVALISLLAC